MDLGGGVRLEFSENGQLVLRAEDPGMLDPQFDGRLLPGNALSFTTPGQVAVTISGDSILLQDLPTGEVYYQPPGMDGMLVMGPTMAEALGITKNFGSGVAGGYLQGDRYQTDTLEGTLGQVLGQIGTGFTPYWGQVIDLSDSGLALSNINQEGLSWGSGITLAGAGISWLPGLGDLLDKGILKPLVKWFKSGDEIADLAKVGNGNLPQSVVDSFSNKSYLVKITDEEMIVFRAENYEQGMGRFFGLEKPINSLDAEIMYNLKVWGNNATELATYKIPTNTTIFIGKVEGGSGIQIFVPDLSKIQLIDKASLITPEIKFITPPIPNK